MGTPESSQKVEPRVCHQRWQKVKKVIVRILGPNLIGKWLKLQKNYVKRFGVNPKR